MRIKQSILVLLISVLSISQLLLSCCSGTSKNDQNNNLATIYDTIYNTDGYLLLKIRDTASLSEVNKRQFNLTYFRKFKGPGSEISAIDAKKEIGAFRKKYNTATDSLTKYADFSFINFFNYISKFKSPLPDGDTETGIRVYPALKKGLNGKDSLTFIFGPTFKGKNQWRRIKTPIAAFNTGSLCPDNCPDEDDNNNN